EPTTLRADEGGRNLVAETRAQNRANVADPIGESELDRSLAGPVFAGKQRLVRAGERGAAARFHEQDEALMDFSLDRFQPLDILGLLRKEGIERHLALAGGVDPPLDAELFDQPVEAEGAAHDPDPAHDPG